ncbi:ArsR/SmtB family transcription factor [Micropruina sp.]|jgi:DNA-binding transcriptional ArsR family regulator|uniref:ArsR/SmtB family transcription factor n=1 Tax=Micropruina sp. TaxID=2737536 RepID=UPI00263571EE|nr:metalloregulator ArsR/SmtB family transcription factor [Micropruina sp.]
MDTIEVIAEPVRRRILDALLDGERLVGDLSGELGIGQPSVSKHLAVLRGAGLVRVRPEAQRRWYSLRPEPLRDIDEWLMPYRRRWADALDALELHLDRQEET